jgi:hypothetical protein
MKFDVLLSEKALNIVFERTENSKKPYCFTFSFVSSIEPLMRSYAKCKISLHFNSRCLFVFIKHCFVLGYYNRDYAQLFCNFYIMVLL